jgi:hypothetical protein
MGLAIGHLLNTDQQQKRRVAWGMTLVLVFSLFLVFPQHWHEVDASHDLRAEHFGEAVLAAAPTNAIIFAKGDQSIFALWYFHFALQKRPDIRVIATDLLHFDWYQESLESTYPTLVLPTPFPWPEAVIDANPQVPVCFVEFREENLIDCQQASNN